MLEGRHNGQSVEECQTPIQHLKAKAKAKAAAGQRHTGGKNNMSQRQPNRSGVQFLHGKSDQPTVTTMRTKGADAAVSLAVQQQQEAEKRELVQLRQFVQQLDAGLVIKEKINGGAFGTVYRGLMDGMLVAIKVEHVSRRESLETEHQVYQMLHPHRQQSYIGIPRCLYYYSDKQRYRILVLPYMGRNLKDIMATRPRRRFSVVTTLIIATQVLSHLEFIHKRGIIHRDIKPQNLIIGTESGVGQALIYLVDFGLSKCYIDPNTHRHIPNHHYPRITGTLRYLGIDGHRGEEASRRDDLQALAYVLVYFLRGKLPWQKIIPPEGTSQKEHYNAVALMKQQTATSDLCKGFPSIFAEFLDYSRKLPYDREPDYAGMQSGFWKELLKHSPEGLSYEVDWMDDYANAAPSRQGTTATAIQQGQAGQIRRQGAAAAAATTLTPTPTPTPSNALSNKSLLNGRTREQRQEDGRRQDLDSGATPSSSSTSYVSSTSSNGSDPLPGPASAPVPECNDNQNHPVFAEEEDNEEEHFDPANRANRTNRCMPRRQRQPLATKELGNRVSPTPSTAAASIPTVAGPVTPAFQQQPPLSTSALTMTPLPPRNDNDDGYLNDQRDQEEDEDEEDSTSTNSSDCMVIDDPRNLRDTCIDPPARHHHQPQQYQNQPYLPQAQPQGYPTLLHQQQQHFPQPPAYTNDLYEDEARYANE